MRSNLRLFLFATIWLVGPAQAQDLRSRARAIHQQAFVFDAHCDTVLRMLTNNADIGLRQ